MKHFDEVTCCEYLDGALQGSELAAFERHLGECDACRTMIEEARRGQADLKRLRLREGPDLAPRIMAAVRGLPVPIQATSETAGGTRRFIGWLSLLASAALAAVLFFSIPRPTPGGSGITRTSMPGQTTLARKLDFPVALILADGRWSTSTNLTNGLFTEPTVFTTGSDGRITLSVEASDRIDLLPDSKLTIGNDLIRIETGAVRFEMKSTRPYKARTLNAGTVSVKAVNAAFGVRIASNTTCIDLIAGNLTLTIASEPPVILTPGTRAICGDRVSLEPLGELDLQAWSFPSSRLSDTAASAVASETATQSVVIEPPVHPQPASAPTGTSPTIQPASATASPAAVSDDPLSTLLDHQPGTN